MSKVKIKNVCEAQCVGFSFKSLKPNQTTVVEEELVTEADKRLLAKDSPLAIMEPWDGVIDNSPVQRTPKSPEKEKEESTTEEMITKKDINPDDVGKDAESVVTPDDVARQKAEAAASAEEDKEAPVEDTPGEEEKAEDTSPEEEAPETEAAPEEKTYTKEELEKMSRNELRTIGKPMGISGRSVEKLIADILKAQGNVE